MSTVDNDLVGSSLKAVFPLLKVFLTALTIDSVHIASLNQLFDFCASSASFEKMLMTRFGKISIH